VRVRFRYVKVGKVRFTSQRDVARMWERPQLSFGLALPTGCESLAEYVDVVFDGTTGAPAPDVAALPGLISGFLPEGVEVVAAAAVEHDPSSLQQQVTSCEWEIRLRGTAESAVSELVGCFLAAERVPVTRERKGRTVVDDLRPSVSHLEAIEIEGSRGLVAVTATQPRGVRPAELLEGLTVAAGADAPAVGPVVDRACRTKQWIERDGWRVEPLPAGDGPEVAARAARTVVCA